MSAEKPPGPPPGSGSGPASPSTPLYPGRPASSPGPAPAPLPPLPGAAAPAPLPGQGPPYPGRVASSPGPAAALPGTAPLAGGASVPGGVPASDASQKSAAAPYPGRVASTPGRPPSSPGMAAAGEASQKNAAAPYPGRVASSPGGRPPSQPAMPAVDPNASPAEKLAALNESLRGTALLSLLNIRQKPAPEALAQRIAQLRTVIGGLTAHLPADDPNRAVAIERLKSVEALIADPLEWHILARADELRQDPSDPRLHAMIEAQFYEEHVVRAVWQSSPPDAGQSELRKSLRLPMLVDVDVDLGGGKKARCRTQNLSRDGVCLEVPADFSGSHVTMMLALVNAPAPIAVGGKVAWRDPSSGRVGVSFEIGVNERNVLDAALTSHFAGLSRAVERWRAIAPTSGGAIACGAIVAYATSALPSTRREVVEKLAEAAKADPTSKELLFALAKLRIEENDVDGALWALKKVVVADRGDPRFRLLELTLQQRIAAGGAGFAAKLRASIGKARLPLAALATVALVAAAVFIFLSLSSPFASASVPFGGLACDSLQIYEQVAICSVDARAYNAVPAAQRTALAAKTLSALSAKGVLSVLVMDDVSGQGIENFDAEVMRLQGTLK